MNRLTVCSGGQSGVDQAALRAAKRLGVETGGFAPKGWLTESGPAPWLGSEYGLVECAEPGYPARTRANAEAADITIWYGPTGSPGWIATRKAAVSANKAFAMAQRGQEIAAADCILRFAKQGGPVVVNFAGNRESSRPGIGGEAEAFVEAAIRLVLEEAAR